MILFAFQDQYQDFTWNKFSNKTKTKPCLKTKFQKKTNTKTGLDLKILSRPRQKHGLDIQSLEFIDQD